MFGRIAEPRRYEELLPWKESKGFGHYISTLRSQGEEEARRDRTLIKALGIRLVLDPGRHNLETIQDIPPHKEIRYSVQLSHFYL